MHSDFLQRPSRAFGVAVFCLTLAGCFGKGDGPEPIPGTPAPPSTSTCDPTAIEGDGLPLPIYFEANPTTYDFGMDAGFGGGATVVVENPECSPANPSPQAARMQKFAAEPFGGSTLTLPQDVDFSEGEVFTMQVWSERSVPVVFKFEDAITGDPAAGIERSETHPGGGSWQTMCFDFSGSTAGFTTRGITFIFDNGVVGNADNDPENWTFYMDAIEQTDVCPNAPTTTLPVDFEDDPATYQFGPDGGFGGGVSDVITNPDQSGLNTTAQTARMRKFAGEVFGGSTLSLGDEVDFSQGQAFTMKVWSPRTVPVLFKFEDAVTGDPANGIERTGDHPGGSTWVELCFDFSGSTAGFSSNAITFIFDNGIPGNADGDPDNWTFYYDEIEQVASCGGPPAQALPIGFEDDPATYDFGPDGGFGGGASDVIANPDQSGINTTAQTARMRKFAAEPFGGSTLALPANVDFSQGEAFTMAVWSERAVPLVFKFEDAVTGDPANGIERTGNHPGGSTWVELCFDFSGSTSGFSSNALTFIFDNGVIGDAENDPGNWTFYYDEIEQVASCPATSGPPPVDFESGTATFADFGGGVATVIANPDASGINTSSQVGQMQKFAGEVFAGSTLQLPGPVALADGDSYLMKVRAQREVVVTLKLETQGDERTATHSGSGTWEELCFDFTGVSVASISGITLIFDNGTAGDAANDPDNWTFQFDDIEQTSDACPAPPPPPAFQTITFDDPATTYTLADFDGNVSTLTNDPAGGTNQVAQSVRTATAGAAAGTTVSTLAGNEVPPIVLDPANPLMTVAVYPPEAGVTVRLKIEDASNSAVFVETDALTTANNAWETLTFDFGNPVGGTYDGANTYNRISIFFNFGALGTDVGEQTYFFDDIAVVAPTGGGGGELAVNGGFEAGDLSGWTIFPNGGTITVTNTEASSGDFSVNVIANPPQNPVIKQEFRGVGTVVPGQTVNIAFDMKGSIATDFGGVVTPELFSESTTGGVQAETLDTITEATADWTTYSYTTTAGTDVSNGITLQIAVICGGAMECANDVFIDNATITLD